MGKTHPRPARPQKAPADYELLQLEHLYQTMRTRDLRVLYTALELDRLHARRRGPSLEIFIDRRLGAIRRVLAERGKS